MLYSGCVIHSNVIYFTQFYKESLDFSTGANQNEAAWEIILQAICVLCVKMMLQILNKKFSIITSNLKYFCMKCLWCNFSGKDIYRCLKGVYILKALRHLKSFTFLKFVFS